MTCKVYKFGLIGLLLNVLAAAAFSQAPVRYAVLLPGGNAGWQTSVVKADGTREYTYEYNDRGRGPKLTTRIKLDAERFPISLETTGNDYLKSPVTETFTFADGMASWKNPSEEGSRRLTKGAFYISMNGAPEEFALLAQALLKSPGHRIALLPEGEAVIKKTAELTIKNGSQTRKVSAYEITGLGFTPQTIWLDEANSFFGAVSSWTSFIREGWEASVPELLKTQDEKEGGRTTELARTLMRAPAGPLVIKNARLFDAETGRVVANTTVVIDGDRIKTVGPDGQVELPKGAETIDAKGRFLMPGLWDMHVHIGPSDGLMHMAAGVTTVRDMANDIDAIADLDKKIQAHEEIGPRIIACGFMDGRGPYQGPTKVFVDTEEEGRAAIERYAKLGYPQIKIYSSIKPELVPKLVQMAHTHGMRLSGHVPAFMNAEQFIADGADEMQHINFFVLNFLDDVKDTRTPARFTTVADRAATLDLNSKRVRDFIKVMSEKKIVIDPTVNVFEGMFTDRPGKVSATFASIADRLPTQVRRGLLAGGLPVPEGKDERYRQSSAALLRMIKMLYDAGVPIVAGTDSMPGFALHRELELYAEAGIPPAEVIRIATIGAAKIMKRDKDLGSIAAGKLADMILVDGDPTQRMSDIRRTSLVIKGGRVYEPANLYGAIGVRP